MCLSVSSRRQHSTCSMGPLDTRAANRRQTRSYRTPPTTPNKPIGNGLGAYPASRHRKQPSEYTKSASIGRCVIKVASSPSQKANYLTTGALMALTNSYVTFTIIGPLPGPCAPGPGEGAPGGRPAGPAPSLEFDY